MSTRFALTILVSFRNEEGNLPILISRLESVLNPIIAESKIQYVFVDDCSVDASGLILDEFADRSKSQVTIIRPSRRFGFESSLMAGLRHSLGEYVVTIDADLQDPPELVAEMYRTALRGFDVVHTRRISRAGEGRLRLFIIGIGYYIIGKFSEVPLERQVGDFKLMSQRVVSEINALNEVRPYIRGLSVWVGFPQTTLDYHRAPRYRGKSAVPNPFSKIGFLSLESGISNFSVTPLYFSIAATLVFLLVLFFTAFIIVGMKFVGLTLPGWAGLVLIILLTSIFQLFAISIISIYLARIYQLVLDRPQFIIDYQRSRNLSKVAT